MGDRHPAGTPARLLNRTPTRPFFPEAIRRRGPGPVTSGRAALPPAGAFSSHPTHLWRSQRQAHERRRSPAAHPPRAAWLMPERPATNRWRPVCPGHTGPRPRICWPGAGGVCRGNTPAHSGNPTGNAAHCGRYQDGTGSGQPGPAWFGSGNPAAGDHPLH